MAKVGGLTERQLFLPGAALDFAHHHQPGMDAQAHGQLYPPLPRQAGIELSQGLHHPEPGAHRPLGVIFVRHGVAEVDQQTIAEILRDIPVIAGDDSGAGVLIGPHYLTQVFRVELARKHGRVHQVAEQHRELAAFGVRGLRCEEWGGDVGRARCLAGKRLHWLGG
jgi:hypothetical protein